MVNSRCKQKRLKMNLKYLVTGKLSKTNRVISKGLRSEPAKGSHWPKMEFYKFQKVIITTN